MSNITNIELTNLIRNLRTALADESGQTIFTEGHKQTLDHIIYNPVTNKLEADRAVETTLNSFYLGEQHKMSSGSENIYFTNLTSGTNWYPPWGGLKDQSIPANQTEAGLYAPSARVFGAYGVAELGGQPVLDTGIPYDGDNFFPYNISGVGITTVVAEVVPAHIRLKYELSVNGTPVYDQILTHTGLAVNQTLSWFFDHPLDVVAGSTNHASIRKIDTQEQDLGLLLVCQGDDITTWGGVRYQTDVQNRGFEDKNIAFSNDLEALDIVGYYDLYVDPTYVGSETGSNLKPYTSLATAIAASSAGNRIFIKGDNILTTEIVLPHSLSFYGIDGTKIRYASYNASNGNLLKFTGTDNTAVFIFKNIEFNNAGEYGLKITGGAASVDIVDCKFRYNGWNGTGLNTIVAEAAGVLGYDSSQADLQAFYAGSSASNGGAMRIETVTNLQVIGNKVLNNLRGIRVADCGINGNGFITRNVSAQNIESGVYLSVGSLGGCQNITVTMNFSAFNANNGLLCIGGINNKFSQNEVNGNWNAGACFWGSSNSTLRDCGLYNNNRSSYNGIGNTGDALASIQINEAYSLLGTNISLNPDARFICEILDTQVHYTGLGSSTEKIGLLITSAVGNLAEDPKNIIKIDDVGFIGQDYAIDLSQVDISNLKLSLGDNSYQSIGQKAVRQPSAGQYFELPFSNHITNLNYVDCSVTNTGNVIIKEGPTGSRINPYKVNDLQAIAFGSKIRVILKQSNKIQFEVPVSGCSIDGVFVNSVLNQALIQLNNLFTNSVGFSGGSSGNPVSNFVLSGNDLTITLQDATSFTVDVTTLGVDENKFVSSGTLNGNNLDLTMNDSSVITIDATNMVNGSSLSASNIQWNFSYGADANTPVGTGLVDSTVFNKQPFYFGRTMEKGEEFTWVHTTTHQFRIGLWGSGQVEQTYQNATIPSNWHTCFSFLNGGTKWVDSSNTLVTNLHPSGYSISNNTPLSLRFDSNNHLSLYDVSGVADVLIGKTIVALSDNSISIQLGTWSNAVFPQITVKTSGWSIEHDYAGTEDGIINGILDHTVLRSNISIEIGEKIMFMLDQMGNGDFFGTGYTNSATGIVTAEEQLQNQFIYQTNEAIVFTVGGASDWTPNTNASGYFNAASLDQYRVGTSNNVQGMFSLRFTSAGQLTLFHEDSNVKIATCKTNPTVGSSVSLFYGAKGNRAYYSIPTISKQSIVGGSQPNANYVPTIANQAVSVQEADVLNFQIVSSDNIVNQYVETDAPSWMLLNQSTGVLSGTAPAYAGSAADTIVVNCKGGNAVGGTVDFTITVTVTQTPTNSLQFDGTTTFAQGDPVNMTAMERATNGDGSAWTVSMWVKPSSSTGTHTLMVYGAGNDYAGGAVTMKQQGGSSFVLNYGTVYNSIILVVGNAFTASTWQHLMVTFDGGTTGSVGSSASDYYSRFKIYVDGSLQTAIGVATGGGYDGAISGSDPSDNIYRIGRASNVHNNYFDGIINQIGIWNSNQTSNIATIYNSGATQDLSLLAAPPAHYYEIDSSVTTITDSIGSVNLTGYNFTAASLVSDVP